MDQEKTYKWIQDRLRDLHSGTLSDADRLRLEEFAKTDPFIADALEGYQSHAGHDHSVLLKIIAQRIQNKNVERRPKLLPLSRGLVLQAIAASFVLILATWAVVYYVQIQNDPSLASVETADSSSTEHSTEVEMTYPDSMNEEMALSTGTSDELNDEPSGLRANAQARNQAKAEAKAKETLSEPEISAPASTTEVLDEDKNEIPTTTEDATEALAAGSAHEKSATQKDDGYYANQMDPSLMSKRITGFVIDGIGLPIPAAHLNIQNTNLLSTSDEHGRFEIFLPDKTSSIEVSSTGYQDTIITVSQGQEDLVVMLESESNTPGNISGGNAKTTQATKPLDNKGIIPGDQSLAFLEYLKLNSRYPIEQNYTALAKSVLVEFDISLHGRPYIKKVDTKADIKYRQEAIRLFQAGPDWICDDGVYPCVKEYTIYFK